jgi:hypothetical protein
MLWTLIWFLVNMLFVTAVITFLFMQRAFSEARNGSAEPSLLERLNRRRKLAGIISIVLFVAMAASFMTNMRLNG